MTHAFLQSAGFWSNLPWPVTLLCPAVLSLLIALRTVPGILKYLRFPELLRALGQLSLDRAVARRIRDAPTATDASTLRQAAGEHAPQLNRAGSKSGTPVQKPP